MGSGYPFVPGRTSATSVPCPDAVGSPLPDLMSELPGKYPSFPSSFPSSFPASFPSTPLPAQEAISRQSSSPPHPPGPGHSHRSLFLAIPSPPRTHTSQMPLPPRSQVAGVRSGGTGGRRVRGRPCTGPVIHSPPSERVQPPFPQPPFPPGPQPALEGKQWVN